MLTSPRLLKTILLIRFLWVSLCRKHVSPHVKAIFSRQNNGTTIKLNSITGCQNCPGSVLKVVLLRTMRVVPDAGHRAQWTKPFYWKKKTKDEGKNKLSPLWGRLQTTTVDSKTVLELSPPRGFGDEEIVPPGDWEATTMIQQRGFVRNLL